MSRRQRVLRDGTGKPREIDYERLREQFLGCAIAFYRAPDDETRGKIRERLEGPVRTLPRPARELQAEVPGRPRMSRLSATSGHMRSLWSRGGCVVTPVDPLRN